MNNRFGYSSYDIQKNKDALIPELKKLINKELDKTHEDELVLKCLALMERYMCDLAYKFAKRSQKTSYEDYMSEMITDIIPHIYELKLTDKSCGSQVVSFLYYWLNDSCQRHFCSMEYATNLSLSKAKKIAKENGLDMNLISKTSSLNNVITRKDDDVVEYADAFQSKTTSPLIALYKKELRKLILDNYGEEILEIFVKIYCKGYRGTQQEHKKLLPLLVRIRNDENLLDMVKELVANGEGLL